MIGDTPADLAMGRGPGPGRVMGVLTGVGTRAELEPLADACSARSGSCSYRAERRRASGACQTTNRVPSHASGPSGRRSWLQEQRAGARIRRPTSFGAGSWLEEHRLSVGVSPDRYATHKAKREGPQPTRSMRGASTSHRARCVVRRVFSRSVTRGWYQPGGYSGAQGPVRRTLAAAAEEPEQEQEQVDEVEVQVERADDRAFSIDPAHAA